jgi:hypothetical protein
MSVLNRQIIFSAKGIDAVRIEKLEDDFNTALSQLANNVNDDENFKKFLSVLRLSIVEYLALFQTKGNGARSRTPLHMQPLADISQQIQKKMTDNSMSNAGMLSYILLRIKSFNDQNPDVYETGGFLGIGKRVRRWGAILAVSLGLAVSAPNFAKAQEYHSKDMPEELTSSLYYESGSFNHYIGMKDSLSKFGSCSLKDNGGKGNAHNIRFIQGFHSGSFEYSIDNKDLAVKIPADKYFHVYTIKSPRRDILKFVVFERKNGRWGFIFDGSLTLTKDGKDLEADRTPMQEFFPEN